MVKRPNRSKKPGDADLFSEAELKEIIKSQRSGIEKDYEQAERDFRANGNIYHAFNVLKAIEAFGDPQAGFKAWKDYALTGDGIALNAKLKDIKVPAKALYRLKKALREFEHRQEGLSRRSLKAFASRNVSTAFHTASLRLMNSENRGGLTDAQTIIFDTFARTRWMFDGPNTDIHPLTAVLAPYFKKAVREKLTVSYEALKEHVDKRHPLIDEADIRKVHEAGLDDSRRRFKRLEEQFYGNGENQPLPRYNFSSSQMPDDIGFGVEFEGFTALKSPFPKNVYQLAELFKQKGLAAVGALNPRANSGYKAWSITIDGSIITPRDFIGRHKTHDLVVQDSPSMEIVSPILKGIAGHADMLKAIETLKGIGFKSNESCGMHMHIGIKHLPFEQQKNLTLAILANKNALDKLLSIERHGDQNKFAQSLEGIKRSKIERAKTAEQLVEALNPGNNRYSKYDITGLVLPAAPPTIQYRGAGGADYLRIASDYTIILANFTAQALKNPDVKFNDVIDRLVAEKPRTGAINKPRTPQKSSTLNL